MPKFDIDELCLLYDKPKFATDFPGGEKRLVQKPTGLRYTLVNSTITFEGNDCTGARPDKLLRSYVHERFPGKSRDFHQRKP